jgi:hypothetical protein
MRYVSLLMREHLLTRSSTQLLVCAWDGRMVILNAAGEEAHFDFKEDVAAFTCGMFARDRGVNTACLVFVSFHDCIHVFHHVRLSR